MVFISTLAPASANAPQSNLQPQVMVQAAAAASASPTAQQLLSTAVVATAYVPPQSPEPPKANKQPTRLPGTPATAALAAQLLAQSPDLGTEELAALLVQQPPADEGEGQEAGAGFAGNRAPLATQTLPEGAAQPAAGQAGAAVLAAKATGVMNAPQQNLAALAQAVATQQPAVPEKPAGIVSFTVQQAVGGKKESLTLTRGAAAYHMAHARNDGQLTQAAISAVS